jgi:hypothetical protein
MTFHRFSRAALFDLVWSKPMRDVAAELGFSDVAVKKACRNAEIPTPPQGHWNRIHAGKAGFVKPTLGPRIFGASDEVTFGQEHWDWRLRKEDLTSEILPPVFDEPMENVRARAVRAVGKLSVSRDLERFAHDAVRKVMRDEASRSKWLAESGSTWSWEIERKGPRFWKAGDQRRMRLLSAIVLGIARGGVRVADGSGDDLALRVMVDFGPLWLTARAKTETPAKRSEAPPETLTVSVTAGYGDQEAKLAEWRDSPDAKLEGRVTEMAVGILVAAEEHYRDRMMAAHEQALKNREWRIRENERLRIEAERKERERREQLERERVERLLGEADAWRQAQAIRGYVADVGRLQAGGATPVDAAAFGRWRDWALAQADRIDPVASGAFAKDIEDT